MFDFVNKMLNGYKTKLGMVGATAAFVSLLVAILSDGIQVGDWQPFITGLSAWLLAVGLGHKASKIEALLGK